MDCPYCSNNKSKVTDKRKSPEGVRRRRECLGCKKRFTTYEKIFENNFYIIKKDKRREKFSREKLKDGVEKAFEKRPVSQEKIDKMISDIEEQLMKKREKRNSKFGCWRDDYQKNKKIGQCSVYTFCICLQKFSRCWGF